MKRIAEALRTAMRLGLYDRDDIVAWAKSVAARGTKPPRAIRTILELAAGGRLEPSELTEILRAVPGEVAPGEVTPVVVGVVARAVASGLDPRAAARLLYTLCLDASDDLRQLADLEDDFDLAENGADGGSIEEVSTAVRERLRAFEHLAAEMPPPQRARAAG